MKPNGPKWDQVNNDDVEQRNFTVHGYHSSMGRSTVQLTCPFCSGDVTAYLWSLHGGGKRCGCGALLSGRGLAYHFRK